MTSFSLPKTSTGQNLAKWRDLAESHLKAQDWAGCIIACHALLKLDPRHHFAQETLSTALLQVGRVDEAIQAVQRLLELSPRDPFHRLRLATLYQMQEQHGASAREFERIAAMYPDAPFAPDALEAIESLDRLQTGQIFLMAAEDARFRWNLERDPLKTLLENDFHLSENSLESLRQMLPAPDDDSNAVPPVRFH